MRITQSDKDKPMRQRRLLLNGKPTYMLPVDLVSKPTCFVVVGTDEILCADEGL